MYQNPMNVACSPLNPVAQEKVLQSILNDIAKTISVIGEAETRLWQATHRIVNPRPAPVGAQSKDTAPVSQTVESQLRMIVEALSMKGQNLHEIASELERAI